MLTVKNSGELVEGHQLAQESVTMKIKILRPTIAQHRQVLPGEELEVSREEATQLIGEGKAQLISMGEARAVKDVAVENTDKPMADVETEVSVEIAPAKADVKPKRGKPKKASE